MPDEHVGPHVEVPPMTRLQIAMSREIGGWPLYTIVIGLGQVSRLSKSLFDSR